jgi:hypothetical protein
MELHTIVGIGAQEIFAQTTDLGKAVFHPVGLNQCGEVLLHFTANLQVKWSS